MTSIEHELAAAREAIQSMDEQLVELYAERDADRDLGPSREALAALVERLDAQVRVLLDDKADLERRLAACTCTPQ